MKTLKELKEMVNQYESKWGKLGHTNIMKRERTAVSHSGINERSKEMGSMNNDFIEFRKKVHSGNQANKIAHTSTVNVSDLNRRYYEEITTNGTLIHAQSALYGTERENTNYYKRIGEPGKYRYFYTKEAYDSYMKDKESALKDLKGQNKSGQSIEKNTNTTKPVETKTEDANANADTEAVKAKAAADQKITDAVKDGGVNAGIDAVMKDERMKKMLDQFENGFKEKGWTMNYDGTVSGVSDEDEASFKEVETWLRELKDKTGVDIFKSKDFQDKVNKEIQNRWDSVQNGEKESKKEDKSEDTMSKLKSAYDEGGVDGTVNALTETKEYKDYMKEVRSMIGKGLLRLNSDDSGFQKIDKLSKEDVARIDEKVGALAALVNQMGAPKEEIKKIQDLLNKEIMNVAKAYSVDKYEANSNGKDNYNTGDKKFVKHSATEGEEDMNINKVQSTNKGEEILDEYRAFKEKANRGAKANELAHSSIISANELNARYEEELRSQCILVHAGKNYLYYNKIELPNGTTRYFYTKAEWDAYQRDKDTALKNDKIKKNESKSLQNESDAPTKEVVAVKKEEPKEVKTAKKGIVKTASDITKKIKGGVDSILKDQANDEYDNWRKETRNKIKTAKDSNEEKLKKIDKDWRNKYENNISKKFKDFDDIENEIYDKYEAENKDKMDAMESKYKEKGYSEIYAEAKEVIQDVEKQIEDAVNAELEKREKSIEAYAKFAKAGEKYGIIEDEIKSLSKYDKQVLADEMGIDSWNEKDLLEAYGYTEDLDKAMREFNPDDYNAALYDQVTDILNQIWKDFKEAKKAAGLSSKKDDED